MYQKIEIAFHFTKEIHTKILVGLKKKLGKHERKTYIFCGWVGGWYTLLRPHSGSQVSIYPNYARPAASLRSNKCERPILGFHFFDGEFLVSMCAIFLCFDERIFCLFFASYLTVLYFLTLFLRFFLPFFLRPSFHIT